MEGQTAFEKLNRVSIEVNQDENLKGDPNTGPTEIRSILASFFKVMARKSEAEQQEILAEGLRQGKNALARD